MRKYFGLLLLLVLINPLLFGQEGREKLKVGYAGSEPFIFQGHKVDGIVIDIWKEIAFGINESYEFVEYPSVEKGIKAIDNGQLDVLVGPITINSSRANLANFSQPYYNTELAILAPIMETSFWDKVKPFLSSTFIYAVLVLLIILTLVGFLFWAVEGRKYPDDYGKGIVKGTASGVWLAVVTMTTVGYGDYAPRTPIGRFVIGSWMVVSLILATSFVAGIATTFAKTSPEDKTITSLNHLQNKRVAVPNYKKIINKVKDSEGTPVPVENVSQGYQMLMDKKVDALIYDEIPLQYIFADNKRDAFVLSKKRIEPQYYGFLFPIGSNLKRQVDLQIIRLQESQEITHIVEDWIHRN